MTEFLVDEDIPPAVVAFLRNKGFDVKVVHELAASGGLRCRDNAVCTTGKEGTSHFR